MHIRGSYVKIPNKTKNKNENLIEKTLTPAKTRTAGKQLCLDTEIFKIF